MTKIFAIEDPRLRDNVSDAVRALIDVPKSEAWGETEDARFWRSLETIGRPGVAGDYATELTAYLETLACQGRWSDGAVAEGIARRAISERFTGNVARLQQRLLAGEGCVGGAGLSPAMQASLQAAVLEAEAQRTATAAAAPPAGGGGQ
jgi:hypothetical protein